MRERFAFRKLPCRRFVLSRQPRQPHRTGVEVLQPLTARRGQAPASRKDCDPRGRNRDGDGEAIQAAAALWGCAIKAGGSGPRPILSQLGSSLVPLSVRRLGGWPSRSCGLPGPPPRCLGGWPSHILGVRWSPSPPPGQVALSYVAAGCLDPLPAAWAAGPLTSWGFAGPPPRRLGGWMALSQLWGSLVPLPVVWVAGPLTVSRFADPPSHGLGGWPSDRWGLPAPLLNSQNTAHTCGLIAKITQVGEAIKIAALILCFTERALSPFLGRYLTEGAGEELASSSPARARAPCWISAKSRMGVGSALPYVAPWGAGRLLGAPHPPAAAARDVLFSSSLFPQ